MDWWEEQAKRIGNSALTVSLTGNVQRADFAGATGTAAADRSLTQRLDAQWGDRHGYDPDDEDDYKRARGF